MSLLKKLEIYLVLVTTFGSGLALLIINATGKWGGVYIAGYVLGGILLILGILGVLGVFKEAKQKEAR